jgi:hypothetical protein
MKARKVTLAIAAAALALPAALATASTAANAGGVIPGGIGGITIDTNSIPPLCASTDPIIQLACQTANNTHTATFSGVYHAAKGSFNDTNESPGACAVGSGAVSVPLCRFTFFGGDPKKACNANPTTPWYQATSGDAWTFYPDKSDGSKHSGGPRLFAEGGGVIDDTGTTSDAYGNLVVYRVHIQIHALCGNEDTAQGLADDISARVGFGSGTLDLSKTYKFTGYYDVG